MFLTICSFHFTGFISSMLILCKYSHFHFLLISNNMRNLALIPIFMRYKTPLNYMQLFLAGLKVDRFDFHNKGLYLLLPPSLPISLSLSYNLFLRSFSFFIKGKAKQSHKGRRAKSAPPAAGGASKVVAAAAETGGGKGYKKVNKVDAKS